MTALPAVCAVTLDFPRRPQEWTEKSYKEVLLRIFVAGGVGAIGKRLIPLLVASGHHVIATSRMPSKLDGLRAQGADPVIVDGLDKDAVMKAMSRLSPTVIVHQTSAIASRLAKAIRS